MFSNAQTALMPRQKAPSVDEMGPAVEPWRQPSYRDAEEGLAGQRRALTTLAWLLPTILTLVLGLVRTTWPGQSSTELDTWALAQRPWSEARQLLDQLDPLSAPYALAMNLWAHALGTGDFVLRLPALLAMAGATALLAKLGANLMGPRAGFVAGLLFAVLPTTSRYAQDIGPYALAGFLGTAATVLLVRAFNRRAVLNLLAYAPVVGLLGLVSLPALALLVGHAVAVLAMRRRLAATWFVAALVGLGPAVVAGYLLRPPIIPSSHSPVSWDDIVRLVPDLFGLALVGGILVGLGLLSLSLRKPAIIFTTWALGPLVALYAGSFLTPFWRSEALLFTVPAWTLLAAAALVRAPVVRGAVVALLAAALSFPLHIDIRQRDGHGLGGPAVATILIDN
ncbi:MAG TPA: glycosyltransferase family 39 protein, partial [Micromonosporaceae bacterium]|nr:glycosyltransferase family 39 protein [Micromonosporaceae bacterium]